MKIPSHNLFELIHALNKNEKSFFKKINRESTAHSKTYLELFNAIDKAKLYDEESLIKKLGYTKKKEAFAVLKNYLYKEILQAVTQLTDNEEHKPDAFNQLQQLNFLANKNLFKQFIALWEKTYKDAEEKELFPVQFLLRNQMHNLKINFYVKTNHQELKQSLLDDEAFNQNYEELQRIKNLFQTIQLQSHQVQILNKSEELNTWNTFIQHPLLKSLDKKTSFHYFYYFHFSKALIYHALYQFETALNHLEAIKNEINKNEKLITANFHLNMEFLSHYYLYSFLAKKYQQFFDYLNKPFNQKTTIKPHKAFIFAYWVNSYTRYFMSNGMYADAKVHLQKTEKQIDVYLADIPIEIKLLLLSSLTISNFIIGNYNEAFYRAKNCMQTLTIYPRIDIQRTIYCMNLIITYELKNKRLLQNECDNFYQYFYRKKISSSFENTMVSFFRKIAKSTYGRVELKQKFSELLVQLKPIKENEIAAQAFRYFNFYGWVESKTMGISYMEYVTLQRQNK